MGKIIGILMMVLGVMFAFFLIRSPGLSGLEVFLFEVFTAIPCFGTGNLIAMGYFNKQTPRENLDKDVEFIDPDQIKKQKKSNENHKN